MLKSIFVVLDGMPIEFWGWVVGGCVTGIAGSMAFTWRGIKWAMGYWRELRDAAVEGKLAWKQLADAAAKSEAAFGVMSQKLDELSREVGEVRHDARSTAQLVATHKALIETLEKQITKLDDRLRQVEITLK